MWATGNRIRNLSIVDAIMAEGRAATSGVAPVDGTGTLRECCERRVVRR